jgi:hypothetical protein
MSVFREVWERYTGRKFPDHLSFRERAQLASMLGGGSQIIVEPVSGDCLDRKRQVLDEEPRLYLCHARRFGRVLVMAASREDAIVDILQAEMEAEGEEALSELFYLWVIMAAALVVTVAASVFIMVVLLRRL